MMYTGNGTSPPARCLRGSPSHRSLRVEPPEPSSTERNSDRKTRPAGHRSYQQSTRDIQAHPTKILLASDPLIESTDQTIGKRVMSQVDISTLGIGKELRPSASDSHTNGTVNGPASSNQFSESPLQYPGYLFVTNNRPPMQMTHAH